MAGRWAVMAALMLGLVPGCDRQEPAGVEREGLVLALGDELGDRQLADVRSIRGEGGRGLGLGVDEQWVKLPAAGWRLGRLAGREDEVVFAWLADGRPLLAVEPSFEWGAVDVAVEGGEHDYLVVMPATQRARPRGYVVELREAASRPQRARAVLKDVVARPMSGAQARDALRLARRVGSVDGSVLDWMDALAQGRVELPSVRRVDAGTEGGDVLGRRQIELDVAGLDVAGLDDARALGMLRGEAALTLLAVSQQQRPGALASVLGDGDAGMYALRSLPQHLPLTEPMARSLVELMRQRLREAGDDEIDALRLQVTAVLDAIGGHAWELMTPADRAAAEGREERRGGQRMHLELAVELGIAAMEHPSWDVQQVGLRMVQRWTEWGWAIPQRDRLAAATPGLGSEEVREQLAGLLEEGGDDRE